MTWHTSKDIEQTANTYNLNAFNKALVKISKAILTKIRLALLKHILIIIILIKAVIFELLQRTIQK
jgi:hypothetical protein